MSKKEEATIIPKEEEYYETIKEKFEDFFKTRFGDVYFEITATGKFSNRLKSKINQYHEIIFIFLKKAASPDITGFVENPKEDYFYSGFVVIEVKKEKIKLDDIYQTRKYAELFDAKYALLISLKQIPDEIKRLSRSVPILRLPYKTLTLVHFDKNNVVKEWFPESIYLL